MSNGSMLTTRLRVDVASALKGVRGGGLGSLVAIAALALGIGASTTASTVAYGGLLRPLPLPGDAQLITLDKVFVPTGLADGVKLDEFDSWRDKLASTAAVAAFTGERVTIRGGAGAQDARAGYFVGHWFQILGAQPLAGRLIDDPIDWVKPSRASRSPNGRAEEYQRRYWGARSRLADARSASSVCCRHRSRSSTKRTSGYSPAA